MIGSSNRMSIRLTGERSSNVCLFVLFKPKNLRLSHKSLGFKAKRTFFVCMSQWKVRNCQTVFLKSLKWETGEKWTPSFCCASLDAKTNPKRKEGKHKCWNLKEAFISFLFSFVTPLILCFFFSLFRESFT